MTDEQRMTMALRVAQLATGAGAWTAETGIAFCEAVEAGMTDTALEMWADAAEHFSQDGES